MKTKPNTSSRPQQVVVEWDDGIKNVVDVTQLRATGSNWRRKDLLLTVKERVKMWYMNKWYFGRIIIVRPGLVRRFLLKEDKHNEDAILNGFKETENIESFPAEIVIERDEETDNSSSAQTEHNNSMTGFSHQPVYNIEGCHTIEGFTESFDEGNLNESNTEINASAVFEDIIEIEEKFNIEDGYLMTTSSEAGDPGNTFICKTEPQTEFPNDYDSLPIETLPNTSNSIDVGHPNVEVTHNNKLLNSTDSSDMLEYSLKYGLKPCTVLIERISCNNVKSSETQRIENKKSNASLKQKLALNEFSENTDNIHTPPKHLKLSLKNTSKKETYSAKDLTVDETIKNTISQPSLAMVMIPDLNVLHTGNKIASLKQSAEDVNVKCLSEMESNEHLPEVSKGGKRTVDKILSPDKNMSYSKVQKLNPPTSNSEAQNNRLATNEGLEPLSAIHTSPNNVKDCTRRKTIIYTKTHMSNLNAQIYCSKENVEDSSKKLASPIKFNEILSKPSLLPNRESECQTIPDDFNITSKSATSAENKPECENNKINVKPIEDISRAEGSLMKIKPDSTSKSTTKDENKPECEINQINVKPIEDISRAEGSLMKLRPESTSKSAKKYKDKPECEGNKMNVKSIEKGSRSVGSLLKIRPESTSMSETRDKIESECENNKINDKSIEKVFKAEGNLLKIRPESTSKSETRNEIKSECENNKIHDKSIEKVFKAEGNLLKIKPESTSKSETKDDNKSECNISTIDIKVTEEVCRVEGSHRSEPNLSELQTTVDKQGSTSSQVISENDSNSQKELQALENNKIVNDKLLQPNPCILNPTEQSNCRNSKNKKVSYIKYTLVGDSDTNGRHVNRQCEVEKSSLNEHLEGKPFFIQELFKCDNIRHGFIDSDLIFVLTLLPDMEEMTESQKNTFKLKVIDIISNVFDGPTL